ncbi:uncharacterized protein OGAPODRAFT_94148 [Ogataea polymorpha]|uniref:uncharacterized protein n=1 Tax=Ogataea polymorpha TaxID=460523 RepID=UPI0007F53EDE|nr:uncharacterized protein OGAPODRAFT_94148 [Ogataea polymorpha]KAG7933416.1 hypothetical protein KL934_003226 [Ogataea polymorpha]OBA15698.1 hypothetical protein OGAPODRAFT_94148 [Ogataea polymorpha]
MASHRTTGSLKLQPMNSANYTAAQDGVQDLQSPTNTESVGDEPSFQVAGPTLQPILDMATASLPNEERQSLTNSEPKEQSSKSSQPQPPEPQAVPPAPSLTPPSDPLPEHKNNNPVAQAIPGKPMTLYIDQKSLSESPPPRTKSPFRDSPNIFIKQINDQRRPLYTPAVLRSDSIGQTTGGSETFDVYKPPERPILKSALSSSSLRSLTSITDYFGGFVRGYGGKPAQIEGPTRRHWKPNNSRFSCAKCNRIFHFMTDSRRKHHCRYCGEIFCNDCLKNFVYLNDNAHFTLFGSSEDHLDTKDKKYLCKVCQNCAQKYEVYLKEHTTKNLDLDSNKTTNGKVNTTRRETIANNQNPMPADWDWSSF